MTTYGAACLYQTCLQPGRTHHSLAVQSISALHELGCQQPLKLVESYTPSSDNMAWIMYTSSSTSPPKGFVLKHSDLVVAIGSVISMVGHHLKLDSTLLTFLPLTTIEYMQSHLWLLFLSPTSPEHPPSQSSKVVQQHLRNLQLPLPDALKSLMGESSNLGRQVSIGGDLSMSVSIFGNEPAQCYGPWTCEPQRSSSSLGWVQHQFTSGPGIVSLICDGKYLMPLISTHINRY